MCIRKVNIRIQASNVIFCVTAGMGGGRPGGRSGRNRNAGHNSIASSNFFSPFGFGFGMSGMGMGFDDFLPPQDGHFTSFSTISSNVGGPSGAAVKRTSTSTRFANGKKIVTKK